LDIEFLGYKLLIFAFKLTFAKNNKYKILSFYKPWFLDFINFCISGSD